MSQQNRQQQFMIGPFSYPVQSGIATITLRNSPVNSLSAALRSQVHREIQHAVGRSDVQAIVLMGADGVFCAGAEIKEFNTPAQWLRPIMPELIEGLDEVKKILIAAIDGVALGAGLELALACHYRVASPRARLGLPEVRFGFPPGAGGTQRLPRLIPLQRAADIILSGSPVGAQEALSLSLVDAVTEGDLLLGALAFARRLIAAGAHPRRTRDMEVRRDGVEKGFFDDLRKIVLLAEHGRVAKLAAIRCIEAALDPFDKGLQVEREAFLEMSASPESKALRHVFFAERQAAKLVDLPIGLTERAIRSAAVIGAGTMGAGIAICFANAGIPVSLIDTDAAALERGRSRAAAYFAAGVAKGRLDKAGELRALRLIDVGQDLGRCAAADIVIEAVFESLEIKLDIFRRLDARAKPGAILGTNTSMLDVEAIASVTGRPQDVVGLHFFSPAHVMRLLEVIRCEKTAPDVMLTVLRLAKTLGKAPVVARVCDGFIGNRMLQRYSQQSLFLLDQGCSPARVDRVMQEWGMAMGPFAVGDLSGLDIGWSIRRRRYVTSPEIVYSRIADRLCEAGRLGQKSGKGWYRYESESRKPLPDPEAEAILTGYRDELAIPQRDFDDQEIVERLIFALVNEGAKILEEGVAERASDIDVVFVTGYGFPARLGGPMYYASSLGLNYVASRIHEFRGDYQGDQWTLSPLLEQLAERNEAFS